MSDLQPDPASPRPTTAGGLLRQARQAQGLHIAALAAAMKVVPRKLEALESDQFDQLPDATFTRALAQSVCRTLKIDAAPVLALLPPLNGHRLEQVAEGLKTPFHERPGRVVSKDRAGVSSAVLWIAALIVVFTVAVYAVPAKWLPFSLGGPARARAAADAGPGPDAALPNDASTSPNTDALPEPAAVATTVTNGVAPASSVASAVGAESSAAQPDSVVAAAASGVLQFRTTGQSWVEVTDARGVSLISRLMMPGETLGLDGVPPMQVKVGNVRATRIVFKGRPLELAAYARDNVARFELK